jgi:hypothetical protein
VGQKHAKRGTSILCYDSSRLLGSSSQFFINTTELLSLFVIFGSEVHMLFVATPRPLG